MQWLRHRQVGRGIGRVVVALLFAALAACSSVPNAVNPVSWYRDLSGASKNDDLDKDQRNQENLEAGSKQPYPNLADVPAVPDRAMSTLDRDALQKSLVADRSNAQYSALELKAGTPLPGAAVPQAPPPPPPPPKSETASTPAPAKKPASAPPPAASESSPAKAESAPSAVPTTPVASAPLTPPPAPLAAAETPPPSPAPPPAAAAPTPSAAPPPSPRPAAPAAPTTAAAQQTRAPQRGDTPPPQESALVSPTVSSEPQGEAVAPPPPPPNIPPAPVRTTAAAAPGRTQTAAVAASQPQHPLEVRQIAQVAFTGSSADLTADARGQLSAVALFQQKSGGAIRIVGHAEPPPGKDALQQQIDGFALALDRAKAVAKVLADAGVAAQDMMVEAAPTRAGDTPHAEIFITH